MERTSETKKIMKLKQKNDENEKQTDKKRVKPKSILEKNQNKLSPAPTAQPMSKNTRKPKKNIFSDISNFALIKHAEKSFPAKLPTVMDETCEPKKIMKSKKKEQKKKTFSAKSPTDMERTSETKKIMKLKQKGKNEKPTDKNLIKQKLIHEKHQNELSPAPTERPKSNKIIKPKKNILSDISNFALINEDIKVLAADHKVLRVQKNLAEKCSSTMILRKSKRKRTENKDPKFDYPSLIKKSRKKI